MVLLWLFYIILFCILNKCDKTQEKIYNNDTLLFSIKEYYAWVG